MPRCIIASASTASNCSAVTLANVLAFSFQQRGLVDSAAYPEIARVADRVEMDIKDTTDRMIDAVTTQFEQQSSISHEAVLEARIQCRQKMNQLCGELMDAWYAGVAAVNTPIRGQTVPEATSLASRIWQFVCAYTSTVFSIACVWIGIDLTIRLILWTVSQMRARWMRNQRALTRD